MKLFQRLLVAPAALGLMAPLAANADVTTEVTQARLDGMEARVGEIMAGSFSSTTKFKAKVNFTTGSVSD